MLGGRGRQDRPFARQLVEGDGSGGVLVTGPRGVGRSSALLDAAEALGAVWIAGLATVADVRHLTLSRLCGEDLTDVAGADAADRLFSAIPTAIVVDDAQDVDAESLEVLVAVAAERRVLLGWSDDVAVHDAVGHLERIRIPPLEVQVAEELARANGGDRVPDVATTAHRSGGIPGLLLALCRDDDLTPYRESIATVLDGLGADATRSLRLLHLAGTEPLDETIVDSRDELAAAELAVCLPDGVRCVHGLAAEIAWDASTDEERDAARQTLVQQTTSPLVAVTQLLALGDEQRAIDAARAAAASATPRLASRLTALVAARTGDPADHLAAATAAVRYTDGSTALTHAVAADGPAAALRSAQGLRLTGDLAGGRTALDGASGNDVETERATVDLRTDWTGPVADAPPSEDEACGVADEAGAEGDLDAATTALGLAVAATLVDTKPDLPAAFTRLVTLGRETGAPLPAGMARLAPAVAFHVGEAGTEVAQLLGEVDGPVAAAHRVLALAHAGRTGDASTSLDGGSWPSTPVWHSIRSWLRAEVALLGGRLVSCRNAAALAADDIPASFPAVDLAALAASRAASEAGETPPAHESRSALAAVVDLELQAIATADADRFDAAAAAWAGRHHPAVLRCRLAAGRLRLPDPAAVAMVEDVAAEADRLGYRVLVAEARRSLRRSGVRTASASGAGAGALSPREREVLTYVAQGSSSREIGNVIGVAASTVDTQVKSAMQKLGARTRLQAATMASELD